MPNTSQLKKQTGFTMIELLIVVAIISVVAAIALPSFRTMIITNRVSTTVNTLQGAILYARSEALKRGGGVTLCKSDNPDAAAPACSNVVSNAAANTGWGSGWIIFADANQNAIVEPGEEVIRVQSPLLRNFNEGSVVPVPDMFFMTFGANGQTFIPDTSFLVKRPPNDTDASHDRYLCVGTGGRPSVSKTLPC